MSTYDDEMPGEPLPSGFTPSVAGRLSPDALRRVMAKIDSVEAARARAAAEARTAWIGCTAR